MPKKTKRAVLPPVFGADELSESSLLQSIQADDVVNSTYSDLVGAGFDEETAKRIATQIDPATGRGISKKELAALFDEPMKSLPSIGGGGFTERNYKSQRVQRLQMKLDAMKNLGLKEGKNGRVFAMGGMTMEKDFPPLDNLQYVLGGKQSTPLPAGIRRERKAAGRLSSMMEASGIEGEGSFLQKGAAKLAQSLGADASVLGGGGKISGILGSIVRGAIKHPIIAATDVVGMGLPLLGLGKDAVNAVSRGVTGDPLIGGISTDQAIQMEAEVRKEQRRREVENQARAQRLAQNTVSLIQNAPLVAQQIMAGRRLPKGAVVIGGTPRVDLMQQMADQMSQGAFQNQDPLQQLAMEQ